MILICYWSSLSIFKEDGLLIIFVFQARINLLLCDGTSTGTRSDLWARAVSHTEDDTVILNTILFCLILFFFQVPGAAPTVKRLMKALTDVFGAEMAEGGFIGMFSHDVSSYWVSGCHLGW